MCIRILDIHPFHKALQLFFACVTSAHSMSSIYGYEFEHSLKDTNCVNLDFTDSSHSRNCEMKPKNSETQSSAHLEHTLDKLKIELLSCETNTTEAINRKQREHITAKMAQ